MAIAPPENMPSQDIEAPDHGLLSEARRPTGSDLPDRWESGFSVQAESCAGAEAWDPCSTGSLRSKSDPAPIPDEIVYQPFVIEAPIRCSSFGWQAADYQGKAERLLAAAESRAIEHEFWTGEKVPSNLSLQGGTPNDDDHILNPGGWVAPQAVSPQMALVLLSGALSACGSGAKGMIHATPGLVEIWTHNGHLDTDGESLRTGSRGDIVIAGSGYTGQGPYGQPDPAPGQVWVFATGMVSVILGDAEVWPSEMSEAFDRASNTVEFRGERTAAVYHDGCCSFAVLVDLSAGGSPVEDCPALEPIARDFDVRVGFVDMGEGYGQSLLLGASDIDPVPASTISVVTVSQPRGPITGTPTYADLPSTWMDPGIGESSIPATVIPLAIAQVFFGPDPIWIRLTTTDDRGCYLTAYAYFPDGIPADWDDGVRVYVGVSDLEFHEVDVAPGPPDPAPSLPDLTTFPLAFSVTDETGICPPPEKAVPVTQACGETWQVEGDFTVDLGVTPVDCGGTPSLPVTIECYPSGGLPVDVQVPEGGLPVAVEPSAAVVIGTIMTGVADGDSLTIPAGARSITFVVLSGTCQVKTGPSGFVTMPAGSSLSWSVDGPNETLGDQFIFQPGDGGVTVVTVTQVAV